LSDKAAAYRKLFAVRQEINEEEAESQPQGGQPEPSQPPNSQPHDSRPADSRPPQPPDASHDSRPEESQPEGGQPHHSQPQRGRPRISLLDSLPEVKGHSELPHQITDHLLPNLDPFEQAVYVQLYRLSWGHKSNRCLISNDRLADRAHMSVAKVKMVTAALEGKGLIKKTATPHGQKTVQGVEYEVFGASWQLQRSRPQGSQPADSRPPHAPNKEKTLKEIDKGSADALNCPDCFGTGMWYPEGFDKGVARCQHKRLTA
jgi:hypothetical protein